jgi:predicted nucleic-acid-binding protein
MAGLDTNVLMRWILDDDEKQAARVQILFEETRATKPRCSCQSL